MRILLASEFYYPSIGGVQEVLRQLGERFAVAGHEVRVATTSLPERTVRSINGVAVEEFEVCGNLVRGMQGEVQRYRDVVLRQEYDVLLIKAAQQWTFDALTPVLARIDKPKIFIPCGFSSLLDPEYADYYRSMPQWLRQFDRLIFYASHYRDIDMAREHGLSDISIVPNGADEREFNVPRDGTFRSRHGIPEDAFVGMTVGTLTGLKGHEEVAAAFEQCDFGSRNACLLMIGNSEASAGRGVIQAGKRKLRIALEQASVGRRLLKLLGYGLKGEPVRNKIMASVRRINALAGRKAMLLDLPRKEVVQAYLNSDLFLFASRIEYSPLVLFEAAAAGLPFVSVPVGNSREIVKWTGGGIVCEADIDATGYTRVDTQVLARHIESLASQPELLARLASSGRDAWQQRFSWGTIFRAYEKIFQECLEKAAA